MRAVKMNEQSQYVFSLGSIISILYVPWQRGRWPLAMLFFCLAGLEARHVDRKSSTWPRFGHIRRLQETSTFLRPTWWNLEQFPLQTTTCSGSMLSGVVKMKKGDGKTPSNLPQESDHLRPSPVPASAWLDLGRSQLEDGGSHPVASPRLCFISAWENEQIFLRQIRWFFLATSVCRVQSSDSTCLFISALESELQSVKSGHSS